MTKISRERVSHLARALLEEMEKVGSVRLLKDREAVRQSISHTLFDEVKRDEERQLHVRERIASSKESPAAGTREWDQLFKRLLDEEYEKQGLDFV